MVKEHIFDIVLCIIAWLVVIVALKLQNAEGYLIGTISGILAVFFYVVRYNQMMIYVEDRVYKKIEKISIVNNYKLQFVLMEKVGINKKEKKLEN